MTRYANGLLGMVCLLLVALAAAGCGGDAERGESCNEDIACEEGLACVSLALGCTRDCPGTCEKPCDTQSDCASDEICRDTRGTQFCVDREFSPN